MCDRASVARIVVLTGALALLAACTTTGGTSATAATAEVNYHDATVVGDELYPGIFVESVALPTADSRFVSFVLENRGGQDYDGALESFAKALAEQPDHRGALMGRAIIFLQTGRDEEAESEFNYLIDFLERTLESDDPTGRGVLAAAFANRGILYDRTARYEMALADYIRSLQIDAEAVSGPGIIDNIILYSIDPSSVRDRAIYLKGQLDLPEDQRKMRIPELDDQQRMHKP